MQRPAGKGWVGLVPMGLALLLFTAVSQLALPRFEPLGPPLLDLDPASAASFAGWQRLGAGRVEPALDGIRLLHEDTTGRFALYHFFDVPHDATALRLQARIATDVQQSGQGPYDGARLFLAAPRTGTGLPYRFRPPDALQSQAASGKTMVSAIVPVDAHRPRVAVTFGLFRAAGSLWLGSVRLEPLRDRPLFRFAGILLAVATIPWLGGLVVRAFGPGTSARRLRAL